MTYIWIALEVIVTQTSIKYDIILDFILSNSQKNRFDHKGHNKKYHNRDSILKW